MKKVLLSLTVAALVAIGGACSASVSTNTSTTTNANKPANTSTVTNTTTTTTTTTNTSNTANTANSATNSNSTARTEGAAQDFKLVNETGVEIHHVYISPSDSNDWEEDILGRDTLPSGDSVDIKFDRSEKAPKWDLKVEAKDGSNITWEDLNLLEISQVTLHYKDGKATAEVK